MFKSSANSGAKMKKRIQVYNKFNGHCAYCGKSLGDNWWVEHIKPKWLLEYFPNDTTINSIDNLIPTIAIINHYKRRKNLEQFRDFMLTFHLRLAKLPKNPTATRSIKHKEYLLKIAELFDITVDKPFDGKFYFEKVSKNGNE